MSDLPTLPPKPEHASWLGRFLRLEVVLNDRRHPHPEFTHPPGADRRRGTPATGPAGSQRPSAGE